MGAWDASSNEFARRIVARAGSQATVALSVRNASSLGEKDAEEAAGAIRAFMSQSGIKFAERGQAKVEVRVTFSENVDGLLWIAELKDETTGDIVMQRVNRPEPDSAPAAQANIVLKKTLLVAREQPVLDLLSISLSTGDSETIAVLGPDDVTTYRVTSAGASAIVSASIPHAKPWPRDLRGRMTPEPSGRIGVFLPGVKCSSLGLGEFALQCRESDEPWPLVTAQSNSASARFVSGRNHFTGPLKPKNGSDVAATSFFSAAAFGSEPSAWAISGLDGRVVFAGGRVQASAASDGWGSELAGVETQCGSGRQILASRSSAAGAESLQAFDWSSNGPVAVSAPLEFSGRITALWPSPAGTWAVVAVRNANTGLYEAHWVVPACSQ